MYKYLWVNISCSRKPGALITGTHTVWGKLVAFNGVHISSLKISCYVCMCTHLHTENITPSVGLPDFSSFKNGVSLSRDSSDVLLTGITRGVKVTDRSPSCCCLGNECKTDFSAGLCNTVDKLLQVRQVDNGTT